MADDNSAQQQPPQTPASPPPAAPAPDVISRADAERIAQERETAARNAAYADARRTFEAKQKQDKPKTDGEAQAGSPPAKPNIDVQMLDFMEDLPSHLSKEQKRFARELYMDGGGEKAQRYVTSLGGPPPATAAPQTPQAGAPPVEPKTPPAGPPASDAGAPGRPSGLDSSRPVWEWPQSQVDRFIAEHGFVKGSRMLADRMKQEMAGVRVYVGPNQPTPK